MTRLNSGAASANWRHIGRKFKYYIRETPQGIWEIEDYEGDVIASFRTREHAFEAVRIFVVEDRNAAMARH